MRVLPVVLLIGLMALAGCTSNDDVDSDGDGLTDAEERQGWQMLVRESMTGRVFVQTGSDLKKVDTDGDGLDDFDEFFLRTDPASQDSDMDGLSDCQEARHTVRSECEDPDFTGPFDGGTDTNPMKADSDPGPSVYRSSLPFNDETGTYRPGEILFGDGLSDYDEWMGITIEVNGVTRVVRPDPREVDTDNDNLEDGEEILVYGSDPLVADTDGDGCKDGLDPLPAIDQSYHVKDITFTPRANTGALQMELFVDGDQASAQGSSGNAGQAQALQDLSIKPTSCNRTPREPVLNVQIFLFDQGADGRRLDITSQTAPSGEAHATAKWNVQVNGLNWDATAPDGSAQVEMSGVDGTLRFTLAVS